MRRAERLHALTEMLRRSGRRGASADRIAEEFGVSARTVKRDIAALDASGAAVWSRSGPGGGYGLVSGPSPAAVRFSPTQAVALLAAVAAAPDAPYADLARAGARKLVDALDPETRARADDLAGRVWVDARPAPRAVRSALEEALVEQRALRLRYTSARGETTTRDVEPVLFAARDGRWFLVAWCRTRDAMRWFAVDRIERAAVTASPCAGHTVDEVGEPPATARAVSG